VVGGDEEQVVLSERGFEFWECTIELPKSLVEPRNVVAVPVELVEIYQIGE
jgi:hypothetical protein